MPRAKRRQNALRSGAEFRNAAETVDGNIGNAAEKRHVGRCDPIRLETTPCQDDAGVGGQTVCAIW